EPVSYPLMPPSAARGAIDAMLCKPEFHVRIKRISVLNQPQFHSIVRNGIKQKASIRKAVVEDPRDAVSDDMRRRSHSLIVKDVGYVVEADIVLASDSPHSIKKYEAMFNRRLEKGQCFYQPYLGTREFSARFEAPNGDEEPIEWTDELGSMFFDFKYPEKGMMAIPYFFNAHIKNGILEVPEYLYKEVLR